MRGEYLCPWNKRNCLRELPPRARRIPGIRGMSALCFGTTSACAENTMTRRRRVHGAWNYLRVRGEYVTLDSISDAELELPPRARRILFQMLRKKSPRGTTSACAENTPQVYRRKNHRRNYLRVRGEYQRGEPSCLTLPELPPRARRIPLYSSLFLQHQVNYLRVRGEYLMMFSLLNHSGELPPRARRIPAGLVLTIGDMGTTSACAENTVSLNCGSHHCRNYLRVRGEYPK